VLGVGGVDAHAFIKKFGPLKVKIFPYKVHFRCLRTHVILSEPFATDFDMARTQLYNALRDCRVFFTNMRWGVAENFEFYGENGSEKVVCGGQLSTVENARLLAKLPDRAILKLIHNGQKILETSTDTLEYKVSQPGIYRLEAWKGNRGWIFSNHIRVAG